MNPVVPWCSPVVVLCSGISRVFGFDKEMHLGCLPEHKAILTLCLGQVQQVGQQIDDSGFELIQWFTLAQAILIKRLPGGFGASGYGCSPVVLSQKGLNPTEVEFRYGVLWLQSVAIRTVRHRKEADPGRLPVAPEYRFVRRRPASSFHGQ